MSAPSTRAVIASALTAVAVLLAYLGSIRFWGAAISIAVLVWFAAPGFIVARRLLRSDANRAHLLFGPVWGIAVSTLGLLVLWEFGLRQAWMLLLAPWPLWLMLLLPLQRTGATLRFPTLDRCDALAIGLLLLMVPLIAGRPYHNVAAPEPQGGKAYRAYFTADFVWAMTVVAEVSKGDTPPKNPFKTGGQLNYYWLAHFLSAAEYRFFGPLGLTVEEVTLANSIGFSLVFVVFLYGFVRGFGAGVWSTAIACGVVFLANSFEGLDRILAWQADPQLGRVLTEINVDAVTRWFYNGMPVDGLHRMILYQPHHLGGYAIGLSALLLVARLDDVARPAVAVVCGLLLGLSLLLTSFTAILIGVAVAVVYAIRLLSAARWSAIPVCAVLGSLPVAAAVWASQELGYVDPAAQTLMQFGLNSAAASHWPYVLLLSFGPLLLLGGGGALLAMTLRPYRDQSWAALVLAVVALCAYFLVDVPDMQHVWVGWRAGHLLFIALTVFTALLLTWSATATPNARMPLDAIVITTILAAIPTTAIDLYNAQDIANRSEGPSFPWTLRLSGFEVEALTWLRSNTPPNVVVQPDVRLRANRSWGYMPAFGERRMAAGLPIAMIPLRPYEEATEAVGERIFTSGSPEERARTARQFGIDYIWAGPDEQRAHPDLTTIFESRSDLFQPVFRNRDVVIYYVAPAN